MYQVTYALRIFHSYYSLLPDKFLAIEETRSDEEYVPMNDS